MIETLQPRWRSRIVGGGNNLSPDDEVSLLLESIAKAMSIFESVEFAALIHTVSALLLLVGAGEVSLNEEKKFLRLMDHASVMILVRCTVLERNQDEKPGKYFEHPGDPSHDPIYAFMYSVSAKQREVSEKRKGDRS